MSARYLDHLRTELDAARHAGVFKSERLIGSPQGVRVKLADGREVLNLCANNYLGLAQHPALAEAAAMALQRWGYGLASVRFICGTQSLHRELEEQLAAFLGFEDTILYSSCFDANGGLFETLLGAEDAIISDALNHASIIDGIRLCKAQRYRYKNCDLADLEEQLKAAAGARFRLIATDGVFSMDGTIAPLKEICDLAARYDAMVMVDDSHATGFVGPTGRGTPELCGVTERIDILTGTLGKALGGASGGFVCAKQDVVAWLRQRSRPYLFSNTLAPPIAAGTLRALELLCESTELRDCLAANTGHFRTGLESAGFTIKPGGHPIVPLMLGEAGLAARYAEAALAEGLYVVGFSYPVVPQGQARLRTQMSAAHSLADLDFAIEALVKARKRVGDVG